MIYVGDEIGKEKEERKRQVSEDEIYLLWHYFLLWPTITYLNELKTKDQQSKNKKVVMAYNFHIEEYVRLIFFFEKSYGLSIILFTVQISEELTLRQNGLKIRWLHNLLNRSHLSDIRFIMFIKRMEAQTAMMSRILLLVKQTNDHQLSSLMAPDTAYHTSSQDSMPILHYFNNKKMFYEVVEYGLLTCVCVYLVNYYSGKDVSFHVKLWSVLTWVLNFALALLVPQDIYQTLKGQTDHRIVHHMGMQYLVLYWSVYLLTWTIIPVLQEWQDAGDLESEARLRRSLRSNGIFYLAMLVGAVVFLIILVLLDAGGQMGLITFLKCLATIWGMLLLMGLMGYGLVEVPKTMWRNADPSQYLEYLHHRVVQMEEEIDQSLNEFKKVAGYVSHLKKNYHEDPIQRYCEAAQAMIPPRLKNQVNPNYDNFLKTIKYFETYPPCLESAIEHRRLMKRAIARWRRQEKAMADYVKQAIFYSDVLQAIQNGTALKSVARKTSWVQELWYCKVRPWFNKFFALIIGLGSICILISETQVFLTPQSSLLANLLRLQSLQAIRVCAFIVMAFLIYMANYSLFRLKLANLYGLYQGESDGASLMFATVNFSRIGVAIVLNFFDMLRMQHSIFAGVMQAPEMGLLGEWVIKGLPGVLWLIVLAHYFNLWAWVANKLGFEDSLAFSSHEMTEDASKRKVPTRVEQKRRELQQYHSNSILRFQQTQMM